MERAVRVCQTWRELALCKSGRPYLLEKGAAFYEFVAGVTLRVKHPYLLPKLSVHNLYGFYQVGVVGNDSSDVIVSSPSIMQEVGRQIDVRPFLFGLDYNGKLGASGRWVG